MSVKSILISQQQPQMASPYTVLAEKFGVSFDFRPFFRNCKQKFVYVVRQEASRYQSFDTDKAIYPDQTSCNQTFSTDQTIGRSEQAFGNTSFGSGKAFCKPEQAFRNIKPSIDRCFC